MKVRCYIDYEVDDSLVRGLDYYSHTVFELEAQIEGFGAQNVLGGGGRYDKLVGELGGPQTPCVGMAFGMDRLLLAMESEGLLKENNEYKLGLWARDSTAGIGTLTFYDKKTNLFYNFLSSSIILLNIVTHPLCKIHVFFHILFK